MSEIALCLIKSRVMKASEKLVIKNSELLTSSLDGYEWSDSRPSHLTPEETATSILWVGGLRGFQNRFWSLLRRGNLFNLTIIKLWSRSQPSLCTV
jgi:hypothetical protein